MPVIGVQFSTFEGRRYQDVAPRQAVRVDHNSTFTSIKQAADDRLRVDFSFTTSYGALGMVKVEGTLMYKHEDAPNLIKEWSEKRSLPPQAAQELHSAILAASVPEAVGIAKGIRLPPPLPIPQVRFQKGGGTASVKASGDGDVPDDLKPAP